MPFEFATAARIVFGPGTLAQAAVLAAPLGRHPLVLTGHDPARAQRLLAPLAAADFTLSTFAIATEPTLDDITRGVTHARAAGCDSVIGFGGGSVLDAAKAISALLTNSGPVLDYLEIVGHARPLAHPAAPCIAIPTTAGTGSEVTRNAVLSAPLVTPSTSGTRPPHPIAAPPTGTRPPLPAARVPRLKVSLRSPHMLPRIALVDPELTYDLPPALTASTGLDALTQLIEPYISSRANPLTDALCIEGLRRAARSLRRAVDHGRDAAAREDMALASLLGGLALANAGLGAVHGFAAPIGGMFAAAHGAVCAALLPHVIATNLAALRARAPAHDALRRYEDIARLVTGRPHATADDLVHWTRDLVRALHIPSLSAAGVTVADVPSVVAAAANASSMKANPLPLTPAELTAILAAAL